MSSKSDKSFDLVIRPDWFYRKNRLSSIIKGISLIRDGDYVLINQKDARRIKIKEGDSLLIKPFGLKRRVRIKDNIPEGFLLIFDRINLVGRFKAKVEKCTES